MAKCITVLALLILSAFSGGQCLAGTAAEPGGEYAGLIQAAEAGDCAALEKMIVSGADTSVRADDGSPVLLLAALNGCQDVCMILLDRGAKPDDANEQGETPLHVALFKGHTEIARLLHDRGADITAIRNDGATALYISTFGGDEGSIDLVLEMLRERSKALGSTPEEHNAMMAEYVNKAEVNGWTPLMNAAWSGNVGLIRKLAGLGADVNARDHKGVTALTMTIKTGNEEAEKALVELGGTK